MDLTIMLLLDIECCKNEALKDLMINMLIAATLLIVKKWKFTKIPTINEWLAKVQYMGLINKLSAM